MIEMLAMTNAEGTILTVVVIVLLVLVLGVLVVSDDTNWFD
jgi:uncharacterized membrane protein